MMMEIFIKKVISKVEKYLIKIGLISPYIYFNGNKVKTSITLDELNETLDNEKKGKFVISVQYNDGFIKSFTKDVWQIHGDFILSNCKNIRIELTKY